MKLQMKISYNSFHFILANLVVDLSMMQSKANIGGEVFNDLPILLVEVKVLHLVNKLENSKNLASNDDWDAVQGFGGVASLREN